MQERRFASVVLTDNKRRSLSYWYVQRPDRTQISDYDPTQPQFVPPSSEVDETTMGRNRQANVDNFSN